MAKLIGTAGHVDHGKTTLIKTLTGIDADRLPEEKARGLTIDIGFAYIDLPRHGRVSIVDVPGHEKFLTNMLVGALGVDVALLCVAADASVMPQTREHFQILELLPVDHLVVAMTRSDLADAETQEISKIEITELLEPTRFKGAPIIAVSAFTGAGIDELREELSKALDSSDNEARLKAPWYLPIDRAFSVKGHGAVVTGTLAQGHVRIGDKAFLEPGHTEVRVRSIHSHDESLLESEMGKRTALNLSGVKLEDLHRGQALGAANALFETSNFDARVRWVHDAKHSARVRVSVGAEEAFGKIFLNNHDPELIQVRLESPVACALGQPVIIRRYSPPDLLCGGRITVPQAKVRRRSEEPNAVLANSDDEAVLEAVGNSPNGVATEEICRLLGKTPQALGGTLEGLISAGELMSFAGLWMTTETWEDSKGHFVTALKDLHEKNPTIAHIPRDRVVTAAGYKWSGKPLDRMISTLVTEGLVEANGTSIKDPAAKVRLSDRQQEFLERTIQAIEREKINVPSPQEISEMLHAPIHAIDEVMKLGLQSKSLLLVPPGLFYTPKQMDAIKDALRKSFTGRPFTAAEARELLGTSRKYVIPVLEYLDTAKFTIRQGDARKIIG